MECLAAGILEAASPDVGVHGEWVDDRPRKDEVLALTVLPDDYSFAGVGFRGGEQVVELGICHVNSLSVAQILVYKRSDLYFYGRMEKLVASRAPSAFILPSRFPTLAL